MSSSKYNLSEARTVFFTESREMLEEMEDCLLSFEKSSADQDTLNALFRSVHTIKGSSGMFGFESVERFTHIIENLLDNLRNGKIEMTPGLGQVLFESHDIIGELLTACEGSEEQINSELIEKKEKAIKSLKTFMKNASSSEGSIEMTESGVFNGESGLVANECWHISLRFDKDIFKTGLDPAPVISYLNEFGKIEKIITLKENLPDPALFDPETCYLGFDIAFHSDTDKEKIESVFEFIKDDSQLRIIPPRSRIADYLKFIEELPESPMQIGEMLFQIGSLTRRELEKILSIQDSSAVYDDDSDTHEKKKIGEIIVDEKLLHKPVVEAALNRQDEVRKTDETKRKSIRIDPDKLDSLINLVGELVISGSNLYLRSAAIGDPGLSESVSTITRLIENVRDSSMNIRMVQIGETFRRYERIVRDLAREREKDIILKISGGETELDKLLIEKLTDPLMHLVRNAADHGIGTPEERINDGKPPRGTIHLNAYHETGSIVIEVKDDGKGLNRDKILDKALKQGIIQPDQQMTDREIYQLIFQPGFSTADTVTSISGRGVGMDVVRKNIESMRGTIEISTGSGGTTFTLNLPLTLAIIDGFMFQVAGSRYIVPLDMVTECMEMSDSIIQNSESGSFINLRSSVLPFMNLRDFFGIEENEDSSRKNVIVMKYAKKEAGIVVDRLLGEFQTVIKPMGKIFSSLKWISGSTILGSGEVALILDVPQLIQRASRN